MPSAFSNEAAAQIRSALRTKGQALFQSQGVKKTSIEELAQGASISKGSFYKFYASKEMLFFELLEEAENEMRAPLVAVNIPSKKRNRSNFSRLIRDLFQEMSSNKLMQIMANSDEMAKITRNVPATVMEKHKRRDQKFLQSLIGAWNAKATPPRRDVVAARMSVLVLLSFNRAFLGDRLLPHAIDMAVDGLVDCFFVNTENNPELK